MQKHILIHLSKETDDILRLKVRRQGDVRNLIMHALEGVNYLELEVKSRRHGRSKVKKQEYRATSITLPLEIFQDLKCCAKEKNVSVSALIDAVIASFYTNSII